MEQRSLKTKLLSLLLAVVMVVTSITVWPSAKEEVQAAETTDATDTGYLELSFDSFGFSEETKTSAEGHQISWLNTLDKVAFTGDFIFGGENDKVVLGAPDAGDNGYKGIEIRRNGEVINVVNVLDNVTVDDQYSVIAAKSATDIGLTTLDNQTVRIRLEFEYEGENANVTVTFTGAQEVSQTCVLYGGATELSREAGTSLVVYPSTSVTIGVVDRAYRELTFSDFGIADQTVSNDTTITSSTDPTYAGVLDGVAINGYVTFPKYHNSYLQVGAIKWHANDVGTNATAVYGFTDWSEYPYVYGIGDGDFEKGIFNREVKMRITFDFNGEDLVTTCTYDGIEKVQEYTGYANSLGSTISARSQDGLYITLQSNSKYIELTYSDFGITDTVKSGNTSVVDNMDGVAVTGYVTFVDGDSMKLVIGSASDYANGARIMYASGSLWAGTELSSVTNSNDAWCSIGNASATDMGFEALPELMELRIMFDYLDYDADGLEDDVRVTVKYSECCIRTSVFTDATDKFGTYMSVPDAYTVKSVEKTFTEYSFENFGYDNPTILNADNASQNSTTTPIESWDGVRFVGTLTFEQSTTDFSTAGVKIAGGFLMGVVNDVFWIWNDTGTTTMDGNAISSINGASTTDLNITTWSGTAVPFSLTFEYFGNNVRLTACIDNKQSNATSVVVMKDCADKLTTDIKAYANNNTTLKIGDGTSEETETCVDTGYLELSFDSFGFSEETKTNAEGHQISWLNTLDKVAFTGDFIFGGENDKVVLGAPDAGDNGYKGIEIRRNGEVIYVVNVLDNVTVDDQYSVIAAKSATDIGLTTLDNQTVRIRLEFEYEGENANVTVTFTGAQEVSQTCVLYGGVTELSREAGTSLVVYPSTSVTIGVVDRAYRELTFGDFGLPEQTVTSGTVTSTLDPTYANVLDGVKFIGYVTFANYNNAYVSLGSIKWFANGTDTANAITTSGDDFSDQCFVTTNEIAELFNTPIEMAVSFDMKGEDLCLTCSYNGEEKIGTIEDYAAKLGNTITIGTDNSNYPITMQSTDVEMQNTTFEEYGIGDQKVTGATVRNSVTPITSLDKVAISGKVTLPANENSYVRFGITSDSEAGVSVRYAGDALAMELASWGSDIYGPGYLLIGADEIGLESGTIEGEALNICVAFEAIRENTTLVSLTVESKVTKSMLVDTAGASVGCGMLVTAASEHSVIIGNYVDRVYTEYTFRDFGLYDQDVTGEDVYSLIEPISSWNNVAINGTLKFSENVAQDGSSDYVRLAIAGTSNWAGIQVRLAGSDAVAMENASWGSNEGNGWIVVSAGESVLGKEIPIRIVFEEQADGSYRVGLSLDGDTTTSYLPAITVTEGNLGFKMVVHTTSEHTITVGSTEEEITKSDETYNIESEPYFLTSTGTVSVNGETIEPGTTLNQAGDYVIVTDQSGLMVKRNVSLYIVGDVNLSSSTLTSSTDEVTLTEEDVAALEKILDTSSSMTTAQEKAADLNNDGIVDKFDLEVLNDIVDGTTTRKDVMEKYYPNVLSFEYLGGNSVMPIIGYRGPSASIMSDTTFDLIDKAGINMFNYLPNENMEDPASVLQELELAEKYGIGVYVTDATINHMIRDESDTSIVTGVDTAFGEELAGLLSRYSYFNSYLGNYIWDEPTLPNQESDVIAESSERNIAWHKDIAKELNGYANTNGYLNVAAGYWFKESGIAGLFQKDLTEANIAEYENVVKTVTDSSNAKVLSFDRYLRDVDTVTDCERYFLNLDIIRKQAIASDIPFWAYAPLGGGWNSGGDIPTTAEFYWQVNMGLAFGAKGIQYYAMTPGTDTEVSKNVGLLNADGTVNSTWYTPAQNINKYIAAVDEVLMMSENIGIIASGTYATNNTTEIEVQNATEKVNLYATITCEDILYNDKVTCIESITGETSYGVLTGVFDYRGKVALYVVNYDTTAEQTVTVSFKDDYRYRTIDVSGEIEGVGQSCSYTLEPGCAVLIVLDSLVGDADGSVALSSLDLVRYKKMEQNVADTDFAYEYAADLNCDEKIDKTDTLWTRWKLIGYMVQEIKESLTQ